MSSLLQKHTILKEYKELHKKQIEEAGLNGEEPSNEESVSSTQRASTSPAASPQEKKPRDVSNMFVSRSRSKDKALKSASLNRPPSPAKYGHDLDDREDEFPQLDNIVEEPVSYTSLSASNFDKKDVRDQPISTKGLGSQNRSNTEFGSKQNVNRSNLSVSSSSSSESSSPSAAAKPSAAASSVQPEPTASPLGNKLADKETQEKKEDTVSGQYASPTSQQPYMFEDDECSEHVATPRMIDPESAKNVDADLHSRKDVISAGGGGGQGSMQDDEYSNISDFSLKKNDKKKRNKSAAGQSANGAEVNESEASKTGRQDTIPLSDDWDAINAAREKALESANNDEDQLSRLFPINFWEAIIGIRRNGSLWKPYTPEVGSGPNHKVPKQAVPAKETLKAKKKGFFDCCSGTKSVSSKNPALSLNGTGGAELSPNIVQDVSFYNALRKMPLNSTERIEARTLYTVYHTIVSMPGGYQTENIPISDKIQPWWQRQYNRKTSRAPSVLITDRTEVDPEETAGEAAPTSPSHKPSVINSLQPENFLSLNVNWEIVGFQGSNPATDLRGTGLLGLLAILYMLDYYPMLSEKIWTLCHPPIIPGESKSKKELKEIPFVLVCLNMAGIVATAIQQGNLQSTINSLGSNSTEGYIVDVEEEKCKERMKNCRTAFAAATTPSYCAPTKSEIGMRKKCPVVFTFCDFFVGSMELFWEEWLKKGKEVSPSIPTVADFNTVKVVLRQRILAKQSTTTVFSATAKARFEALLDEAEKKIRS